MPEGQLRHCDREVAPLVGPYVPAGQLMHRDTEVAPLDGLYVPEGQDVQLLDPGVGL